MRPCPPFSGHALGALMAAAALSCNGTTGDELVTFAAYAAGAAHAGDPFPVNIPGENGGATPYSVQIMSATMHIGALYLNENPPDTAACIDNGLYSDQVPGAIDVDLLSTTPQKWTLPGNGTADLSESVSIWLTDGAKALPATMGAPTDTINSTNYDSTVLPFSAFVTINPLNRGTTPTDPAYPGENPICLQRVISVPLNGLTIHPGDSLLLTIDPRAWFGTTIDFSQLAPVTSIDCLGDPSAMPPAFPDAGIVPTACIPNTNSTASTNGAPIGAQFLTDMQAGNPSTYTLSVLK